MLQLNLLWRRTNEVTEPWRGIHTESAGQHMRYLLSSFLGKSGGLSIGSRVDCVYNNPLFVACDVGKVPRRSITICCKGFVVRWWVGEVGQFLLAAFFIAGNYRSSGCNGWYQISDGAFSIILWFFQVYELCPGPGRWVIMAYFQNFILEVCRNDKKMLCPCSVCGVIQTSNYENTGDQRLF